MMKVTRRDLSLLKDTNDRIKYPRRKDRTVTEREICFLQDRSNRIKYLGQKDRKVAERDVFLRTEMTGSNNRVKRIEQLQTEMFF